MATTKETAVAVLQKELNTDFVQGLLQTALKENASSFAASLIEIYSSDSNLQECPPALVIREAMKAASLKLTISKALGLAYIVPYKGKPQFQLGYKGFIQLAIRSGQYETINADIVYDGELTTQDKLKGTFSLNGTKKSDTIIGYFAHLQQKNGFQKTFFMTVQQITAHAKKYSKTFNSDYSPWKSNFDEMGLKTVLKHVISHYGSLSVEMVAAFDKDIEDEITENANTTEVSFTQAEVVTTKVKEPKEPKENKEPTTKKQPAF